MNVLEHEHPLDLIDLMMIDAEEMEEYDEDDDEFDDSAIDYNFRCPCNRCGQEILQSHRYYYKCNRDSCDFSIHKSCAELPPTLTHTSHDDVLTLLQRDVSWRCNICRNHHDAKDIRYRCSECDFDVDISCALAMLEKTIHHPSHIHPLLQISKPILCMCSVCGKEHKGIFYHCITCPYFFIHSNCAFLPKKLLIQNTTNNEFSHTHPLTLAYSFPIEDQREKYYPECRVCGSDFEQTADENLWIYKCEKCWFYTHLDCATSRGEPFMSIFSSARHGKTRKNYEDADHPDILHLPFPDQTYNIPKHKFFKEIGSQTFKSGERNLTHTSHQHTLILVDTQCHDVIEPTSSEIITFSIHDPMKKIQLLCDACVKPIMSMPFYKCDNENDTCNFVLHEWCTRLPAQVENHPGHPQHPLVLLPKHPGDMFGLFECDVCRLHCNGFVYRCVEEECEYSVDVSCAFIPEKITHTSHPNHLMWRLQSRPNRDKCSACSNHIKENRFSYSCHECDFDLHAECALLLPETTGHKFDKHPLKLSYLPIENHKSKYFCEICEEEFNPSKWFYHCYECVQSMHSGCAPLILECESVEVDRNDPERIYELLNIKLGGIHKIEDHPHPLTLAVGIVIDGDCSECSESLRYNGILKCQQCRFANHIYCCKELSSS